MASSLDAGDGRSPRKASPAIAAALIGGPAAGAAGAIWSARAIARRNGARHGDELSAVMRTAVTACELAHGAAAERERRQAR